MAQVTQKVETEGRLLCPEIGLLGSPTNLTCIEAKGGLAFIAPRRTSACETSTGKCVSTGPFTASVINTTASVLTIPALLKSHAGIWKCGSDGDKPDSPSCQMTVAKLPTCTITGRRYDDSDFIVDEEVALKVNVTGYYCSESVQFQLQTGNIQTGLDNSQWNATTSVIFNLTETHIGEVKLVFKCGGYRQALTCEGIQQLGLMTNVDDDDTGVTDTSLSIHEDHCRSTSVIAGTVGAVVILLNVFAVIICLRRHHLCQMRQASASYLGAVYVPGSVASDYGYATVDDVGYVSGQYLRPTVD
ncbi:uncharacterized protein [Haliotis asinina]|uniref:uncharacterized protein n=1 Tax=Haliotis asinina TaxID=109174 RepID=UPI0035325D9B